MLPHSFYDLALTTKSVVPGLGRGSTDKPRTRAPGECVVPLEGLAHHVRLRLPCSISSFLILQKLGMQGEWISNVTAAFRLFCGRRLGPKLWRAPGR